MLALWWLDRWIRDASVVDVAWCLLFVIVVSGYAWFGAGEPFRRLLVAMMAAGYGLRLGIHVLYTRVLGRDEDPRYRRLRREWGARASSYLLGYCLLQAGALVLFSWPLLVVMQSPRPTLSGWEYVGILIWVVALVGETVADLQLADFKRKLWNRERVCRDGLWYYSRHPNYFFEWLHWWSYVAMGIGLPNGTITWLGPLAMGWALLKVSGIPHAERQSLQRLGDEYRRYQRTTSRFIPWFPRRDFVHSNEQDPRGMP
ncbi:MAG: DUF1295 domain-containing protein [Nitrospiraceae bacterium]